MENGGGNLPTSNKIAANKQKGKKTCNCCGKPKNLTDYYLNYSPMYALDQRTPICKDCCKSSCLADDGSINMDKLKDLLRQIDRPLYLDLIASAEKQVKKENSFISDDEVKFHGEDILSKYFTGIAKRQDRAKSYSDSEKEGFFHQNSNRTTSEINDIKNNFDTKNTSVNTSINQGSKEDAELNYSDKWMGSYSKTDLEYLENYYTSLDHDYNVVTENHRDYARKIAKASLAMDKAFNEMTSGITGAEVKYKNMKEAFDSLSKSAKFSESTRSVNDVGASSFSKVAAMVESHNWIPEHHPLERDTIDEMIDYLSTITKSL